MAAQGGDQPFDAPGISTTQRASRCLIRSSRRKIWRRCSTRFALSIWTH